MADLHAMKRAGITRAFIGNQGLDDVSRGPVRLLSEQWWQAMHAALKTASDLDIEIGIFNGPGWSHMGGQWVKPEQSMRYLALQQVCVDGGRRVQMSLLRPEGWLSNVRLLAYPARDRAELIASPGQCDFRGQSEHTITLHGQAPFTLRQVRLVTNGSLRADVSVQARVKGRWEQIKSFRVDRYNLDMTIGYDMAAPVAEAVPGVKATDFRVVFSNMTNADARSGLRALVLSDAPVVERYSEKILAFMHPSPLPMWTDYKWPRVNYFDEAQAVDPATVIDITDCLDGDAIDWSAPEGRWNIVRAYMAPTGITCAPAFEGSGKGLEVDRWNRAALAAHYDAFMGEIERRIPPEDRRTWRVVVCDSYETATQNFGDDFFEYFTSHFGYDPTPYLLTYGGTVVGSSDRSDRFLWDLRRMIADRLADDNIAAMDSIARSRGKHLWLENYGHWGFPGEFLQYGSRSTEVAGEFWSTGDLGNIENRAASSCVHTYGKRITSAESFTFSGPDFVYSPRDMKARGDRFFAEGINNTLLHVVVSQPDTVAANIMQPWFGNEFHRKNPWHRHLDLFTAYLKRCNALLQSGRYVAQVAYFIGEDCPVMTGITQPACPDGLQFDYINAEILLKARATADHHIELPSGSRYNLLVLPPSETMRPDVAEAISRLVDDGAYVLANTRPVASPSLQGYPEADRRVAAAAASLWDTRPASRRGRLLTGLSVTEALQRAGHPTTDFRATTDGSTLGADVINYCHIESSLADIYFLANATADTITFVPHFTGMAGRAAYQVFPALDTCRVVDANAALTLFPLESTFVIFSREPRRNVRTPQTRTVPVNASPWQVRFQADYGVDTTLTMAELADWTTLADPALRYLGGRATYTTTITLPPTQPGQSLTLDLGQVDNTCRVWINDEYIGGQWTYPYRIAIPDTIRGTVSLRVEVANNLANRLIGDLIDPGNAVISTTRNTWTPASPLQPAGLKGPLAVLLTTQP